jgi:hypothetical protein
MKPRWLFLMLILMFSLTVMVHAQQPVPFAGDREVTVMTQNLYGGVDEEIFAVPSATSFPDLLVRVADVYNGYFARDFPSRAARIATEASGRTPISSLCRKRCSCGPSSRQTARRRPPQLSLSPQRGCTRTRPKALMRSAKNSAWIS